MIVNRPVIIQGNSDFAKKSDVEGSTAIPATVNFIRTAGYVLQGDGGGGLYKRGASEPGHSGKIRDSNSVWWELADVKVNVKQFGAVGDGTTDDTTAIRAAISFGNEIHFPAGTYLVSGHIAIPDGKIVRGAGRQNTILKRSTSDTTTATITDSDATAFTSRNTLVFIESGGTYTTLSDMTLSGNSDATTGTTLIETGNNARFVNLERLRGVTGRIGLRTSGELWMSKLSQVTFTNCEKGIDASNSGFKTSLNVRNVYLENCGTGYQFTNTQYSVFDACGADHIARPLTKPYDGADVNPYGVEFGDEATSLGVYNFSNCKAIAVNSCGTENSWGNGAVRNQASEVVVNGFRIYNLQSAYLPNYGSFPAYGVGPFQFETENGSFEISGVSIDTYTQRAATSTLVYFCGFNFLEATYGAKDFAMVSLLGGQIGTWSNAVFGGQGNVSKYCRDKRSIADEAFTMLVSDHTGTDVSTAQPFFGTGADEITLVPGSWEFELVARIARSAGTVSHTTSLVFGGTATYTSFGYTAIFGQAVGSVNADAQTRRAGAATEFIMTAASIDATEQIHVFVRGMARVNAAGTIIPQFKYSAAPGGVPTVISNSFFRIRRIGTSGVSSIGAVS
jgi:hypothetical protein